MLPDFVGRNLDSTKQMGSQDQGWCNGWVWNILEASHACVWWLALGGNPTWGFQPGHLLEASPGGWDSAQLGGPRQSDLKRWECLRTSWTPHSPDLTSRPHTHTHTHTHTLLGKVLPNPNLSKAWWNIPVPYFLVLVFWAWKSSVLPINFGFGAFFHLCTRNFVPFS